MKECGKSKPGNLEVSFGLEDTGKQAWETWCGDTHTKNLIAPAYLHEGAHVQTRGSSATAQGLN